MTAEAKLDVKAQTMEEVMASARFKGVLQSIEWMVHQNSSYTPEYERTFVEKGEHNASVHT